jgi:hypothetical protein
MADVNCIVSRAGRNAGLLSIRAVTRNAFVAWKGRFAEREFELEPQSRGEVVNVVLRCPDAKLAAALAALDVELGNAQLVRGTPRSFAEPFPDRPGYRTGRR